MQHIATNKSEFAALPVKVAPQKSHTINQQIEFQSFLREANPIYSQPVEPKRVAVDKAVERQSQTVTTAEQNLTRTAQRNAQSDRQEKGREMQRQASENRELAEQKRQNDKSAEQTLAGRPHPSEQIKPTRSQNQDVNTNDVKDIQNEATTVSTDDNQGARASSKEQEQLSSHKERTDASDVKQQDVAKSDTDNPVVETDQDMAKESSQGNVEVDVQGEVDWLALVESSLRADLAASDKSNSSIVTDSMPTEDEIILSTPAVSEITTQTASPIMLTNEQQGEHVVITEQQITEDLSKIGAELAAEKQNNALALLANLLNKDDGAKHTIAQIDQALEDLLLIQDNKEPEAQRLVSTQDNPLSISLDSESEIDAEQVLATTHNGAMGHDGQLDAALLVAVNVLEDRQASLSQNKPTDSDGLSPDPSIKPAETNTPLPAQTLLSESSDVSSDIQRIANLSEQKLDAALSNLADRLISDATKERLNTSVQNLEKMALGANPAAVKLDFVASLKAGIDEIKAQLQQGHQPSIDLTSLVTDSLAKATGMPVAAEQISGSLTRFNQTLEVASLLKVHNDGTQLSTQIEKVANKDSFTQAQVIQNKQGQQIAQFDKAVNITRNEGIQQMAEKVRWMVNQNNLQAEIRLDPPDLGAMKVRVNMAGDAATVSIVVQSQQARDALEQATPRLKELLEQQGIELGQSSVQQEQSENNSEPQGQFAGGRSDQQDVLPEESTQFEQPIRNGRLGGIDYFV